MSSDSVLEHYWHPVAWSSDIGHAPYATELLERRIVIWRGNDGPIAAVDRCPHRSTAMSLGECGGDGSITCGYHGWRFSSEGSCVEIPQLPKGAAIPPRAALSMLACEERYGLVWATIEEPWAAIPAFPEWDDASYRHVPCPAYTWRTSAGRMVENFTDFGHLGYLHDGLLGTRDDLIVPRHHVEQIGEELHYELTMQVPNTNDRFAVTDVTGERGTQTNSYVLTLPFAIHLQCRYHDAGTNRTLFFAAQPKGPGVCTGYCYQSRDFDLDADDEPFAAFQELLSLQDQPIVESQSVELPLDVTEELHLGFDKVAIAYRRAMRAFLAGELAALVSANALGDRP